MSANRYATQPHQRELRTPLFDAEYDARAYNRPHAHQGARNAPTPPAMSSNPFSTGLAAGSAGLAGSAGSASRLAGLESQNDDQIQFLSEKVKILKGVTLQIGDEIRDSTKLFTQMEDNFDTARARLKNTYNRMMVMSKRAGVGWRTWLGVFFVVFLWFFYVWVF